MSANPKADPAPQGWPLAFACYHRGKSGGTTDRDGVAVIICPCPVARLREARGRGKYRGLRVIDQR